jgi:hypothetical protein
MIRRIDDRLLMRRVFELEPNDFIYLSRRIGGMDAKSQV